MIGQRIVLRAVEERSAEHQIAVAGVPDRPGMGIEADEFKIDSTRDLHRSEDSITTASVQW